MMQDRVAHSGDLTSRTRPAKVLVTGFGPFPGVAVNASEGLAHLLAQRAGQTCAGATVTAATLPTDWLDAPRMLARLLASETPDVCVHLGVSARAKGFVIESRARNRISGAADVNGFAPTGGVLLPGAPPSLTAGALARAVEAQLADAGVPSWLSQNAGAYLCNAIYYCSLLAARQSAIHRSVLLVHLPDRIGPARKSASARPGSSRLSTALALKGGVALIEACLASWRAATAARTR